MIEDGAELAEELFDGASRNDRFEIAHAQNNQDATQISDILPLSEGRRVGNVQNSGSKSGIFADDRRKLFKAGILLMTQIEEFH